LAADAAAGFAPGAASGVHGTAFTGCPGCARWMPETMTLSPGETPVVTI
jgi:hypothetical protein